MAKGCDRPLMAYKKPDRRRPPLTAAASAAAARHADGRLFIVAPPPARRRRPAIEPWSALHQPHIRTQRVAGQVLSAAVAPELARLQRRIAAHAQQRLVSRV